MVLTWANLGSLHPAVVTSIVAADAGLMVSMKTRFGPETRKVSYLTPGEIAVRALETARSRFTVATTDGFCPLAGVVRANADDDMRKTAAPTLTLRDVVRPRMGLL
jgi:hypothetical protein